MKRNKVFYDAAKKQLDTLAPEDVRPFWIKAIDICKTKVEVVKSACDTAYSIIVCIQKENPKFAL